MAKHTIQCTNCGNDYETARANTKRCNVCRLFLDLQYTSGGGSRKCWLCDEPFAPINDHDKACADCTYKAVSAGEAPCAYCGYTRLRITKGVDVCHVCARDPKQRQKFARGLRDKISKAGAT